MSFTSVLQKYSLPTYLWITAGVVFITAGILLSMGRVPICDCGSIKLWHGIVNSSENSQHISDWYTFSHVIHGFLFFWFLWLGAKSLPLGFRVLVATIVEAGWEILENTEFIINRYREATISLDYFGDSVINSTFDILAMLLGFWLAHRLPVWVTVLLMVVFEILTLWLIRDGLLLNIIMLVYPLDAILDWQSAG